MYSHFLAFSQKLSHQTGLALMGYLIEILKIGLNLINFLSHVYLQAKDCCADVVNIKISKFGGLTKAKQAIELCAELGLAMTIEGEYNL